MGWVFRYRGVGWLPFTCVFRPPSGSLLRACFQEHFEVFGFLCLRQAFSADEMAEITRAADEVWTEDRGGGPDDGAHQSLAPFAERHPQLLDLAEDGQTR